MTKAIAMRRLVVTLTAALLATGIAAAEAPPLPEGFAIPDRLSSVDATAGTVTLESGSFAVAEDARLLDVEGRPIGLRTLAAEGVGRSVSFRVGVTRTGGVEIHFLQLIDGVLE